MDSVKTDNEGELTSTMGNVLSVSNKSEKNDTSDATPTSSTDANTTTSSPRIVSDDPISSTSSDIESKLKNSEENMQQSVEVSEGTSQVHDKCASGDAEADLLEINISNVSSEKITEDVEDLVHDLESLLGESTDSFNIPVKRKVERKSVEDEKTLELQKGVERDQEALSSGEPLSTQLNEDQDNDASEKIEDSTNKRTAEEVQEIGIQECNIEQAGGDNEGIHQDQSESSIQEIQTSDTNIGNEESITPSEPQSTSDSSPIDVKDPEEVKEVNDSVDVIIENAIEPKETESATENIDETQQIQTSEQVTLTDEPVANEIESIKDNNEQEVHETECTKEIVTEPQTETIAQEAGSIITNTETEVHISENEKPEESELSKESVMTVSKGEILQSMPDISPEDHNLQEEKANKEPEEDITHVSEKESILGDIKTESTGSLYEQIESTETISGVDKETKIENLAEAVTEELPAKESSSNIQDTEEIEKENLESKNIDLDEIKPPEQDASCAVNSEETALSIEVASEDVVPKSTEISPKATDIDQTKEQCEVVDDLTETEQQKPEETEGQKPQDLTPSDTAAAEQNTDEDVGLVIPDVDRKSEVIVNEIDAQETEGASNITQEVESQVNIPKSAEDIVQENIDAKLENPDSSNEISANVAPNTDSAVSEIADESDCPPSSEAQIINPKSPIELDTVQTTCETSPDLIESAVDTNTEVTESTPILEKVEEIQASASTLPVEVEKVEQDDAPAEEISEVASEQAETVSKEEAESETITHNKVEDIETNASDDTPEEAIHAECNEALGEVDQEEAQPVMPSESSDLIEEQSKGNVEEIETVAQASEEPTNEQGLPESTPSEPKDDLVITPTIPEKSDIVTEGDVDDNITQVLQPENPDSSVITPIIPEKSDIVMEDDVDDITQALQPQNDSANLESTKSPSDIIPNPSEQIQIDSNAVPTSSNESIMAIDESPEINTQDEKLETVDSGASPPNKIAEPDNIETPNTVTEPEEMVCVPHESEDVIEQKETISETEHIIESAQIEDAEQINLVGLLNEIEPSEDSVECTEKEQCTSEEITETISTEEQNTNSDKPIEIVDNNSKAASIESDGIQILSPSIESDSEEMVPVLALEPEEDNPILNDVLVEAAEIEEFPVVTEELPEVTDILSDLEPVIPATDLQENLDTILAAEPEISEKERMEMEALRKAVESITDVSSTDYTADIITINNERIKNTVIEVETVDDSEDVDNEAHTLNIVQEKVVIEETDTNTVKEITTETDVVELKIEESVAEQCTVSNSTETTEIQRENEVAENQHTEPTTSDNIIESERKQKQLPNTSPDSSNEVKAPDCPKEKDTKLNRTNERPRRHKKSSADNKLEELSINVDVPDKDKPYSPKVTIKPIKVPDEEVSTTSNSDTEIGKGSLKMTITKQSDKMHSILKICEPESAEPVQEQDEPIPKLIIKPKIQQIEQHSPKMSTRSGKQVYSPTSTSQRSGSPRITIKPVVKPDKAESVSPLKIKIKPEEGSKKHSPKLSIKASKSEEDVSQENIQSPRKVTIKPVVKPVEVEQVHSPRITIKPIPKPDSEKESMPHTPKLNIKPIKKQEDDDVEIVDKERSSPKITIKPVVKPQEPDTQSGEAEEEVKERIVLKINKGNLPTPTKESKKRDHSVEEDKSEKLAKITVKFSKGGGHAHIVQQPEESNKRVHEEHPSQERSKKQKTEPESPISTRSKHKQEVTESSVETRSKQHKDVTGESTKNEPVKSKQKDTEVPTNETSRSKHQHPTSDPPPEPKRAKLRDSTSEVPEYDLGRLRHREPSEPLQANTRTRHKEKEHTVPEKTEEKDTDDVTIVETKLDSPIVISEDSRSQDSGSCVIVEDLKDPLSDIPVFEINLQPLPVEKSADPVGTKSETATPPPAALTTPSPRKRGRPRKVIVAPQDKLAEDEVSKQKQQPPKEGEPQPAPESGRPKRSCRGQSARATLGIKPRKPRGPGRGRGSKRGMGDRSVPMKPQREPKLSKAKLKLMQQSIKQEISNPVEVVEKKEEKKEELSVFASHVEIKPPAPVLPPPEIPISDVPVSPSPVLHVPSPQASVPSPAQQPVASPKSANPLGTTETPLTVEAVTSIPSTSRADSTEIVMVDEETRMSADTSSRAQTPAKQIPVDVVVEESQSSVQSTATTESGKAPKPNKTPRLEVQEPEGAVISADQLTEYYWNGNGPFMLQEQVAQFLGIKSFKRKYPGIMRRMLEMQERDFIRESGLASEHMCDLGLTAVNSADILDIMYSDFQEKYEEYCKHQRDRQAKELINKQRALSLAASQEKNKADITEQAVQSAAQWNATFNKIRKEQRKACMDLQTLTVHYPKGKMKQINKPKVGNYPIALVPGQFTDYYKEFTPTEINNLPINTMCYDAVNLIGPEESDDSGSDGSESDSDSSSSSSGSGSDSSSGVEDCKLCKHSPRKGASSK